MQHFLLQAALKQTPHAGSNSTSPMIIHLTDALEELDLSEELNIPPPHMWG